MVTIVSCFYQFKHKYTDNTYFQWIQNFTLVQKCQIIVYTDKYTYPIIASLVHHNPNILLVLRELEEFSTYPLKEKWDYNHSNNPELNTRIDGRVNMLYAEKIAFVQDSQKRFPEEEWFIWCDIGYFRCQSGDITRKQIKSWPNIDKISTLHENKVYYNYVVGYSFLDSCIECILNKNIHGLPTPPIPAKQMTFAGGFFIIHRSKINWWSDTFYRKLGLYFHHKYIVKDDQMIVLNCIIEHPDDFHIIRREDDALMRNPWFSFQHFLL